MASDERDDFMPEPENAPPWEKDNWDGTIVYAQWEMQGLSNWALTIRNAPDDGGEVLEKKYSVGGVDQGWTSFDGNEIIKNGSDNPAFNANCNMQAFLADCINAGAKDELLKRSAEMHGKMGRRFADIHLGLRYHWDIVERIKNRQDKATKVWAPAKVMVMVPTKFLGVGELPNAPVPGIPQPGENGSALGPEILVMLKELAKDADNYDQFSEMAAGCVDADGALLVKDKVYRSYIVKKSSYEALLNS